MESPTHPAPLKNANAEPLFAIIVMLVAGIVASALAAPALQHYQGHFRMVGLNEEETNRIRADANDPIAWAIERGQRWDQIFRNASLQLGLYGVILGAVLGLSEGLLIRSVPRALLFSIVLAACGAVGGILAAVAESAFGVMMGDRAGTEPALLTKLTELTMPKSDLLTLAMHISAFVIIGMSLGLGFAVLTRKWSVILRSAGGGIVAGMVFLPLSMAIPQLQNFDTNLFVPEGLTSKLLFLILAGGLIGLCVGRAPRRVKQSYDVPAD
jgi:hypothetical protein